MCRAWYYPCFQAPTGDLSTYLRQIRGDHCAAHAERTVNQFGPASSKLPHRTSSLLLLHVLVLLSGPLVHYLSWALQTLWSSFACFPSPMCHHSVWPMGHSFKFKCELQCFPAWSQTDDGFPLYQDKIKTPDLQPLPGSFLTLLSIPASLPRH